MTVRDPETGSTVQVGTGFSDSEREWIFAHRDQLEGAVVKVDMMTATESSARAPSFRGFHEGKGNTEVSLLLYAETLAGLDQEEAVRMKHKLINSARG
jgi:hypothetical protein